MCGEGYFCHCRGITTLRVCEGMLGYGRAMIGVDGEDGFMRRRAGVGETPTPRPGKGRARGPISD